jgi:succinoglycan biosynthesis transport protein ExoP
LRGRFDQIIIDSAPVLPVADSQLIAKHADGVIVSVIRSVSELGLVYEAYERLSALRCRILGAVVHGISGGRYGAGTKYSYRSEPETTEVAAK